MNTSIQFVQLDPRPQALESQIALLAKGGVLGIEVTVPALASVCDIDNLDHHNAGDTAETPSACEQALKHDWTRVCCACGGSGEYPGGSPGDQCQCDHGYVYFSPTEIKTVVTVRTDADSVTAMAVLKNRLENRPIDAELVSAVGRFDRLGPSAGKPAATVSAIARKAFDFKLSLADRVQWVADLLAGADKTEEVKALISVHDAELEAARKASELTLCADGRIAVVLSTHRFGTTLGYENAPVVVAYNPAMPVDPKDPNKGTYGKFTVCRYDSHVKCDLPAALRDLQVLEPGWGGRGDIFGSPQGVGSILSTGQVVEVVSRHLK